MPDVVPGASERPLHEITANLSTTNPSTTLSRPAWIGALEILSTDDGPTTVAGIIAGTGSDATLQQQYLATFQTPPPIGEQR